ncbi:High Affinity Camp-Specific And Ibmx-Insensitive 3',5'-Cyclic Phosphodiesterase 8A [Manis pentadactyla]|nr:High Affinity Camp-Specific And Ibmx-Insensitive 3',5'-Cyclic Phosphodiesterase 8A [Manis pentadactyla]
MYSSQIKEDVKAQGKSAEQEPPQAADTCGGGGERLPQTQGTGTLSDLTMCGLARRALPLPESRKRSHEVWEAAGHPSHRCP